MTLLGTVMRLLSCARTGVDPVARDPSFRELRLALSARMPDLPPEVPQVELRYIRSLL